MTARRHHRARAFTIIEVVLVIGLLLLISAITLPNFFSELKREELPTSANQLRALVTLVRANAAFDAKRFRIRFPQEGEADALGGVHQPIVEREDDPIAYPEVFHSVNTSWAVGKTLLGEVRCAEVRLGRPTVADIKRRRESASRELEQAFAVQNKREEFERDRPPVYIEPDGTSDWATFTLTKASLEIPLSELYQQPGIDVILDGLTGLCWLQRSFYDEELDLFEEKNWPAVMRKDFLTPRMLTEQDVLELRDLPVQARGESTTAEPVQEQP
jgi:hypothetical protein